MCTPLTISCDVNCADAAEFDARHVKLPACLPLTESIVSTEFLFPIFAVVMPEYSITGRPLNNHLNSMGKSPDVTRHWTLAESA